MDFIRFPKSFLGMFVSRPALFHPTVYAQHAIPIGVRDLSRPARNQNLVLFCSAPIDFGILSGDFSYFDPIERKLLEEEVCFGSRVEAENWDSGIQWKPLCGNRFHDLELWNLFRYKSFFYGSQVSLSSQRSLAATVGFSVFHVELNPVTTILSQSKSHYQPVMRELGVRIDENFNILTFSMFQCFESVKLDKYSFSNQLEVGLLASLRTKNMKVHRLASAVRFAINHETSMKVFASLQEVGVSFTPTYRLESMTVAPEITIALTPPDEPRVSFQISVF